MQDLDAKLVRALLITLAVNAAWVVPLVFCRWFNGLPLTAQSEPEDHTTRGFRIRAMLAVGMFGGLGIAAILEGQYISAILMLLMCIFFLWGLRHLDSQKIENPND